MPTDDEPTATPDPNLPGFDLPRFGWKLPNGGSTAFAQQEESSDEAVTRFVLYGGGEVRYHPALQLAGDVIELKSLSLKNYARNPVALLEHNQDVVVGTGVASVEDGRLLWTVTWDTHPSNPAGILVAHQHARKIRRAASIGFMPGKESVFRAELPKSHPFFVDNADQKWATGRYHRKGEMFEGSSVSIPKDPTALQLQTWALGTSEDPVEQIRRYLAEVMPREARELVLQAVRSDPAVKTAIESAALGAIPSPHEPSEKPATWAWSDWS